jgi:hypothetical protein
MVLVAKWALIQDYKFFGRIRTLDMDIAGNALLMVTLAVATIVYFNTFNGEVGNRIIGIVHKDDDRDCNGHQCCKQCNCQGRQRGGMANSGTMI